MASGVDTEFPYRGRIVDRLITATLFAATLSDSQKNWVQITDSYRRGIGVGVKRVTGRDAIFHKRRRNSSQKATQ